MTIMLLMNLGFGGSDLSASVDVFMENRDSIELGMKPLTAAGLGGVLIE